MIAGAFKFRGQYMGLKMPIVIVASDKDGLIATSTASRPGCIRISHSAGFIGFQETGA